MFCGCAVDGQSFFLRSGRAFWFSHHLTSERHVLFNLGAVRDLSSQFDRLSRSPSSSQVHRIRGEDGPVRCQNRRAVAASKEEVVELRVIWAVRFASMLGGNYAMLVTNLPRFALVDKLNCALDREISVRRSVHKYLRKTCALAGRFKEIVVHETELFEFLNHLEAGCWRVQIARKRSILFLVQGLFDQ